VGPLRPDGKHELLTVYQRVDVADRITVDPAPETGIRGFGADTVVQRALAGLGAAHGWHVEIEKHIPVAAGLGGGSSDAATTLRLANQQLAKPLSPGKLHAVAAATGADVPFFLVDGPQLGSGDGTVLEPLDLPQDFAVLLFLPAAATKTSTGDVYAAFDARGGAGGFEARAAALRTALAAVRRPRDLAALPPNDLASSPFSEPLRELGAFRADVSGAGPTVYGLFHDRIAAENARRALRRRGRGIVTVPAWYG
jgi:4-diphosphocytidyl-2-C-methyl-D-erythritol kinase